MKNPVHIRSSFAEVGVAPLESATPLRCERSSASSGCQCSESRGIGFKNLVAAPTSVRLPFGVQCRNILILNK